MAAQTLPSLADTDLDQRLQEAHVRLLARYAPGTRQRRVRWSGGETQVLELGGGGPPIVLLHGGLGDAFQFAPIMPALARRFHLATQIPAGARLVEIPDAGHLPWLDNPARVTSEIERALEA